MTVQALVEFAVSGYEHSRQAFVGNTATAGACESALVFSSAEDERDDRVVVLMRWPDREIFARFRAEMERDMASGGDMAPGEVAVVDDPEAGEAVTGLVEHEDLVETRRTASP